MKRLLESAVWDPKIVTQIEVDQEIHRDTIKAVTGLDNTKEIRDAMLDQVVWKDLVRTARDDSQPR